MDRKETRGPAAGPIGVHPTIVIGYGAYGLRLLRSLLARAATRSSLQWTDPAPTPAESSRRLQSLSLFWIKDTLGQKDQEVAPSYDNEATLELFDDLYDQITPIEGPAGEVGRSLAMAVARESERLLQAETLASGQHQLGLDVILLARPTTRRILGQLREVTNLMFERLGSDRVLRSAQVQGGDLLLNALAIFDFDNIWDRSMQPVRASLAELLGQRSAQFREGDPVLGRIYLFDGTTARGHRDPHSRMSEAALLLDLLLFEGLRNSPELRELYRPAQVGHSPICSIGVRSIEHSSGLLRRLAAASYTRRWIRYLIDESPVSHERTAAVSAVLAPFSADRLPTTTQQNQLDLICEQEIRRLEGILGGIRADRQSLGGLDEVARKEVGLAVNRLSSRFTELAHRLEEHQLRLSRVALDRAIGDLLTSRDAPLSLGALVRFLEQLRQDLEQTRPVSSLTVNAAFDTLPFEESSRMIGEAEMHAERQVKTPAFRSRWWPAFALVFAVALTPLVLDTFDQWWSSAPAVWLQSALVLIACGSIAWLWGTKSAQVEVESLAALARQYYFDKERGRITERLRNLVESAGVGGRLREFSARLQTTLRYQAVTTIATEIRRTIELLRQRQREALWLDQQCGALLNLQSVDDSGDLPHFKTERRAADGSRSLERDRDLHVILKGQKRDPDSFAAAQGELRLDEWRDPYFDGFIHPLLFLDRQAGRFSDGGFDSADDRQRLQKELLEFIDLTSGFTPSFRWFTAPGLSAENKYAVLPATFATLPSVEHNLQMAGYSGHIARSSGDRLYLIVARLGVAERLLQEQA